MVIENTLKPHIKINENIYVFYTEIEFVNCELFQDNIKNKLLLLLLHTVQHFVFE